MLRLFIALCITLFSRVLFASGSIDGQRMRSLTQLVDRWNRSIWLDVITLVVAVFIGVGVGFGVLKIFFPDLLSRSTFELNLGGN